MLRITCIVVDRGCFFSVKGLILTYPQKLIVDNKLTVTP